MTEGHRTSRGSSVAGSNGSRQRNGLTLLRGVERRGDGGCG